MKPGLTLALASLTAFLAGLIVSPLFHSGAPTAPAKSPASPTASSKSATGPGGRLLPFADTQRIPATTAELVSDLQAAADEPNIFRRIGRMWWLSEHITPENAREVAKSALEKSRGIERNMLVSGIFAGWAHVDPRAAVEYAQGLPNDQRQEALMGAMMGWAGDNFDAASAWVDKQPPGELKRAAQRVLLSTLAESDPDRALQLVMDKSKGSDDRSSYAYSIFGSYAKRDPAAAAERAAHLPEGRFRNTSLRIVADNWSQQDRAAALAWVDELPEGPAKQQTVSGVLQNWVRSDFDGALEWLQKRPEGSSRSRTIQELTYAVASDNPENAIKLVDLVPSNSGQDQMLENIARIWSRNDPDAALQWARSQTDGAVTKAIWEGLITGMATETPAKAAALAVQLPPNQQSNVIGNVARNWASQDPAAAAQWSTTLAGDTRTQALGQVMSSWVENDPATALKWFSSTPPGKDRDSIVNQFTGELADTDPNLALQWAQSISDTNLRQNRLEYLARNWLRNDSTAARNWIANSSLTPESKKRLLATPP